MVVKMSLAWSNDPQVPSQDDPWLSHYSAHYCQGRQGCPSLVERDGHSILREDRALRYRVMVHSASLFLVCILESCVGSACNFSDLP